MEKDWEIYNEYNKEFTNKTWGYVVILTGPQLIQTDRDQLFTW